MIESVLLNKLKEKQAEYAIQALKYPGQKDAYEFGYRVGVFQGFEAAINVLLDMVKEQDSKDL